LLNIKKVSVNTIDFPTYHAILISVNANIRKGKLTERSGRKAMGLVRKRKARLPGVPITRAKLAYYKTAKLPKLNLLVGWFFYFVLT